MQGLEAARALYETRGRELIHRRFPEYEGRIAVGLAGHGSECFGFDDAVSADHDFEPGFCLWVDDETDRAIGLDLSRAYRELKSGARERSAMAEQNRGVRRIGDFYRRYTGTSGAPETWQAWLYLPSHALAEASNGQVWRDDQGSFSAIRQQILTGMPEDVRKKRLAAKLITMAQAGQYNYSRCLKHGQPGSAMLAMAEFVNAACAAVFLLNRRHMPYYKWQFRAMESLPLLGSLKDALEFLLTGENDPSGQTLKAQVVEDICAQTVGELRRQRLTCGSWDYLEPHAHDLMEHIENPQIRALHVMEE